MVEPIDENQARKFLAAFADGELSVEQNLRVLEHMAMNPQATRRVMHQQQLRDYISRTLCHQAPSAPESLRRRVEMMKVDTADRRPVLARIGRWFPAALAAGLLIAALVLTQRTPQIPTLPPADTDASVVVASEQASRFARRHTRCSRMLADMNNAQRYPRELAELPEALHQIVGSAHLPSLDLTAAGFRYKMAGDCRIPGQLSSHLVYESITGSRDALSLWVTPYRPDRHAAIEPDTLYESADPGRVHPILFWRRDDVVFFLVGDDLGRTTEAAALLRHSG